MATIIKAGNVASGAQITPDATGILQLNTGSGAGTAAMTIATDQSVTFAGNLTVDGNTTLGNANTDTILMTAAPSIGGAGLGMGFGFRNRIINGAMVIAQRATSAALQFSSTNYTALDRFCGYMGGASQSGTFSRVAITDLSGFNYCAKLQRTAGGTNTANIQMGQAIETLNCADLAGQIITFSFYAKAGANFSASGSNVFVQLASGNGVDQSFSNMTGSLWTGQVNLVNFTSQVITTTWARYSFTVTLGATASQIGFQIIWTPVGTAGADDAVYVTGVQIEKGGTTTTFDYRPYGTELALCQRYFEKSQPQGSAVAGGTAEYFFIGSNFRGSSLLMRYPLKWAVTKRAAPTVTFYNPRSGGTASQITTASADYSGTTPANILDSGTEVQGTTNSGGASGDAAYVNWTASIEL